MSAVLADIGARGWKNRRQVVGTSLAPGLINNIRRSRASASPRAGCERSSEGHMHRPGFLLLAGLLSATTLLNAADDRTPWGDPDLQGIWSNQTPTPLERPDALAGKATLSEEEAAEFEKTSLERLLTTFAREVPISGELNGIWLETAKGRVPPGRSTSLVVDPADGKIPYTDEGRKRWDAVPKIGKPMLANVPEDRTLAERCITTDGVLVPNPFYNNYIEIVQAPGSVAIVTEMMHETRVIRLDARPHINSAVRTWSGDSREIGRASGRERV